MVEEFEEDDRLLPATVISRIDIDTSAAPSRTPSPVPTSKRPIRAASLPPPDVFEEGICDDEEDLYFAKLVLAGVDPAEVDDDGHGDEEGKEDEETSESLGHRKHETGSARTEGFYKIDQKDKAAYVAQYQNKGKVSDVNPVPVPVEESTQHVTSSRSNRANARRRAAGLEEINQVQRAVALSKGETAAAELTFKFNQLQTRKKHLRFSRSPIHDWGLYAMEKISRGEMVIEYVGEVIRAQVAEMREKTYERQGIGSSYLFRIDEELVVDATKKGNLGRLINHSCDPNCTAKIITINGEKKIVIYAKQDIEYGDEITYDYHFPFEQDKIPCLCGSAKCRGFLN
ncbi:SET domain-containing protein [Coprinellus micaceus]|uniref:Histone-lysine N-methyltransferase, H3 lysine-4 specific n=1 Tax=Coprinellus micaceus TaxID=71717 RepID=A0A4Y7SYX8_COPMI|nr:SET domain-containing protein [Coprinellus micaceus]